MIIYTIGFTQKSAEVFFTLIKENKIAVLADVRLNNASQLAGFSKGKDLEYFLREICGCQYAHELNFAPAKEIFDAYKSRKMTWPEFEGQYQKLIQERDALDGFYAKYAGAARVCLLCSEPTPEHCHRRLLAELLQERHPEIAVKHL